MNKEVRQLVRQLVVIPGVTVKHSGGHLKVMRDEKFVVTLPSTPSDHRWRDNAIRELKRQGLTPRTREMAPEFSVEEEIPIEKLREAIVELFDRRGAMSAFARFTIEVGDVLGIPGYKNAESAVASLSVFRQGGGLRDEKRILLEESLRMWRQRQASEQRALRSYTPPVAVEPEDEPEEDDEDELVLDADGFKVQLQVDLAKLNELLDRVGITIVVK
jgi:hypothetical protein